MDRIKLTVTFIIVFLSFNGYTQDRIIQFQKITFEDGISDNRINNIIQDKEGFIWFVTPLGIDKYDGQKSKSYLLPDENDQVNDIIQDNTGIIWAATSSGLFYFDVEKDYFKRYTNLDQFINNSLNGYIISLMESNDGSLWCTNASSEIITLRPNSNKETNILKIPIGEANNSPSNGTDIIQDGNGTIWISTSHGELFKYQESKFIQINLQNNDTYINAISEDQEGHLWIGTNGNGLFKYNNKDSTSVHYTTSKNTRLNSISNNFILDLLVDKDNNLWIGTDGGGLNLYRQDENKFYSFKQNTYTNYPIADNSILSIHQGSNNIIWVGTVHGGASYFKNHTTISHVPPSKLAFNQIDEQGSQLLEASSGDIWITAGRNGLRRYNPQNGEVTVFIDNPDKNDDLSGNNIISLFEDNEERIWIGTYQGGLNIFDTKNNRFLNAEDRYEAKAIFAIEKNKNGEVWVGTNSGINVYNSDLKIIRTITTDNTNNLNANFITALYNDIKGDMWVGTNLGLNVIKSDTVLSFTSDKTTPHSLSSNRIRSITEDEDLSLLIGTYGHGLNKYDRTNNKFKRIGEEKGLEANIIGNIFLDRDKNIWCSTNLGLSKIKPDGSVENFGLRYGVHSYRGGSAILTKSNHILMGGRLGLSYFKASELNENNTGTSKVFFTSGTILGEDGKRDLIIDSRNNNHITLTPSDNILSINYSSSDYWNPKKNIYAYKLKGLNNDWQIVGNQQALTFSNLKPGDYTLMVNSAENIDNNDYSLASINITVLPTFWQKSWVRVLSILTGILLILLFIKLRLSTIKKQQERLELLVASKTEEVKSQQEKVHQSEIALLQAEKDNQELTQKKLIEELNFKTEELTNYTLRTVHKNHLLTEIKSNLLKETKETTPKKRNLEKIVALIDDSLMLDEDWENFYNLFNQIHTTFIKDLKNYCPQLTDREIRLCALIKLNFNSQHIATLFGISLSSVKVARHRLRKKLNISVNESYEDFFNKLT
ncbi:ligand-binding sensor domain-containing protein [Arenibacter latericius]|uniref:ligand-binding sensor domain-containing protein n=1 Tax=Arenibacter latericius TaxID=86104 RepID=UPI0003F4E0DA|nr:two-component regulator propeller domain-containing protein [Arenibacter latericius]